VGYKSVRDIDFTSAKTKKRKLDQAIAESSPVNHGPKQRKLPVVQEPNVHELDNFFSNLSRTGTKPAILSLVPKFAKSYRPKVLDSKYPTVFLNFIMRSLVPSYVVNFYKSVKMSFKT
jgi:hypothetical protein